jgi:hypothetical protein
MQAHITDALTPPAAVDIIFSRVKTKGRRTITYEQFMMALAVRYGA